MSKKKHKKAVAESNTAAVSLPVEEHTVQEPEAADSVSPAIDDHQVVLNVRQAYEEACKKRSQYKKIGPLTIALSGVAFLSLIFTLENKVDFLVLWVIIILYCAALMIRAEYKCHQFAKMLGIAEDDTNDAEEENQS